MSAKVVDLARRRILVVEDEYLLAADIVDQIEDNNGVALGPVASLQEGLAALHEQKPDACIIDIHLGLHVVYELADRLIQQEIPFVFASSEVRASIPHRFIEVPLHSKPIDMINAAVGLMGTREP